MAVHPESRRRSGVICRLRPFIASDADRIAAWVCTPTEAYWLAPKTTPPITNDHVLRWQVPGHHAFSLCDALTGEHVGYGEVNRLSLGRGRFWLGHLIVASDRRGRGYGRQLTSLLLRQAFTSLRARQVTLVVFPENQAAVACYRAAGMVDDGWETHDFPAYRKAVRLLRMAAYPPGPGSRRRGPTG